MKRLIILNRDWSTKNKEYENVIRCSPESEAESNELLTRFSNIVDFISEEGVLCKFLDITSNTKQEKMQSCDLILKLYLDITTIDKSSKEGFLKQFENIFVSKFNNSEFKVLHLYHHNQGFSSTTLSNLINKYQWYYIFGEGIGPVYGSKGLLDTDTYFYDVENSIQIAKYNHCDNRHEIEQTNFDRVWNYYWQNAIPTFKKLRECIFKSQIGPSDEHIKDIIISIYSQKKYYEYLNFENIHDINEILEKSSTNKYPFVVLKAEFEKIKQGNPYNKEFVNRYFDELITYWS